MRIGGVQAVSRGSKISRVCTLVWSLAKNDLKARFAGSAFGALWVFVFPAITVAIYGFVFQVGFRAAPVGTGAPYVIWLVCGMAPWFFFTEAWLGAGNALLEYHYLVKKVVFPVEALPLVKIVSASFFHAVFIFIVCALFLFMRQPFSAYLLQLPYYVLCLTALLISIGYFTAAVTPFFRDAGQIVQIFCQLGFWLTPIAWQASSTIKSPAILALFKANPMYYIVEGYRSSLIGGAWFYENGRYALYFWVIVSMMGVCGALLFKRMRPHFADLL